MHWKEKDITVLIFGDRKNRTNTVIITELIDASIVEDSHNMHKFDATQKIILHTILGEDSHMSEHKACSKIIDEAGGSNYKI